MNPDFHEVPYECHWCGKFGHALGDKCCTVDWMERLHALLVCNECGDLMAEKNKILDEVRSLEGRLEAEAKLEKIKKSLLTEEQKAAMIKLFRSQVGELRKIMAALRARQKAKPT